MSNDMFHPRHNSGMIEVREVEHEKPMDSLFFGDGDRHSDRTRAERLLNTLVRNQISVWDGGAAQTSLYFALAWLMPKLRPFVRKHKCNLFANGQAFRFLKRC